MIGISYELMNMWRERAMNRKSRLRETESKLREAEEQIKKLEEVNAFLVVESQRQAADARIWEHRFKSLALNKIPDCGEV